MRQFAQLVAIRLRAARHSTIAFLHDSKLRVTVVLGLLLAFWALMFVMFLDAFIFVRSFREISSVLLDYLFAFFFLSLLVMMTISNAIIAYASLYRSEETEYLYSLPLPAEDTFSYRAADSMTFSLWGMATLVLPMILAYGIVFGAPLSYYLVAVALALLFLFLATELGALCALLVAAFLPRRKKGLLVFLAAAGLIGLAVWLVPLSEEKAANLFTDATIRSIMDRIAFCQHWALPSIWVAKGMLAAGRSQSAGIGFYLPMLLANVLFLGIVVRQVAFYLYRRSWETIQGSSTSRSYAAYGPIDRVCRPALVLTPRPLAELVIKDVKTFLREPAQWSQFLLFFGLLGLYVLSLPRFGVQKLEPYWHSLISTLNLGATCLTLATLTTRFVFPQLSLEGRRIWITGLIPMRRAVVLWSKFVFAAVGTFAVSGPLIALSDLLIGLPLWVLGVHLLVVAGVCCGLNGLAVGLGALYPRLGTDNPSKIVSSFGGTLNLVCSICFIVLTLAPVVVPLHESMLGGTQSTGLLLALGIGLGLAIALSAAACMVPMWAGARAFARMEF